ncbi:hypothetical protein [Bacillus solimangrovi]|uniref:DUF4328 domain-containing protein n=1 Tax=Bacillus solimangrovi TaxID=1305675 RepID=A0A1E5LDE9_9BACI|nr:hypothetical protein [Bacillus solimangrovi]OEH92092.1 hypothetical protein BFG57_16825 [Bacillus solimangrovi]
MSLRSHRVSKLLIVLLKVVIALTCVSIVTTFIAVFFEQIYLKIMKFDALIDISTALIFVIASIMYLVWLFKIHRDLKDMDFNYSITAGGALARVLVPIYNIWGIWNIYSTMARYLVNDLNTKSIGLRLKKIIIFYYILELISRLSGQLLFWDITFIDGYYYEFYLISYIVDLILVVFYVQIVRIVMKSIKALSEENGISDLNIM